MPRKIFYFVKPIVPRRLQLFLRRILVKKKLKQYKDIWPIFPGSEEKPLNWMGWANDKRFAFILTHDVELKIGHDRCKQLLQIEKDLGFKSSYNFVPERYKVDRELREYIVNEGFEVGVHGLNHDGKLFGSKNIFSNRAKKINHYLEEWDAVGFRAPAMHHNLEWIKELKIEYDLSTFDTDPFEPQSDGVGTIFPFWVDGNDPKRGYLELPYTLVQDFTLFILMKEKSINIWKKKIDWIAEKGGMALLNVHPDYISFDNKHLLEEFPIEYYSKFLKYVKTKYDGQFWNALPSELCRFWKQSLSTVR